MTVKVSGGVPDWASCVVTYKRLRIAAGRDSVREEGDSDGVSDDAAVRYEGRSPGAAMRPGARSQNSGSASTFWAQFAATMVAYPPHAERQREERPHDLEQAINDRRSTRVFLPDKLGARELVDQALDPAIRAPSNSNVQPWHLRLVSGPARERLVAALLAELFYRSRFTRRWRSAGRSPTGRIGRCRGSLPCR
jgi:hypothetical protein